MFRWHNLPYKIIDFIKAHIKKPNNQFYIALAVTDNFKFKNKTTPNTSKYIMLKKKFDWIEIYLMKKYNYIVFNNLEDKNSQQNFKQLLSYCKWNAPYLLSTNILLIIDKKLSTVEMHYLKQKYFKYLKKLIITVFIPPDTNFSGLDDYILLEQNSALFCHININQTINKITPIINTLQRHYHEFRLAIMKNIPYYLAQSDHLPNRLRIYQLPQTLDRLESLSITLCKQLSKSTYRLKPIKLYSIHLKIPDNYYYLKKSKKNITLFTLVVLIILIVSCMILIESYFNKDFIKQRQLINKRLNSINQLSELNATIPTNSLLAIFNNYKYTEYNLKQFNLIQLKKLLKPTIINEIHKWTTLNTAQSQLLEKYELNDTTFTSKNKLNLPLQYTYDIRSLPSYSPPLPLFSKSNITKIEHDITDMPLLNDALQQQISHYWKYYIQQSISTIHSVSKLINILKLDTQQPKNYTGLIQLYKIINTKQPSTNNQLYLLYENQLRYLVLQKINILANNHINQLHTQPQLYYIKFIKPLTSASLTSSLRNRLNLFDHITQNKNHILVYPIQLSTDIKSASLTLGILSLKYMHGPNIATQFNLDQLTPCTYYFVNFNNEKFIKNMNPLTCLATLFKQLKNKICINHYCLQYRISSEDLNKIKLKKLQLNPPSHIYIGDIHGTTNKN